MSWYDRLLLVALLVCIAGVAAAVVIVLTSEPATGGQLRNAYWPYSVEMSVRDR